MPLLSTTYCTIAELQRFLSANAVTDFADHDDDGSADTDVVEDAINQATEEIDLYLRQQYTQANLSTSTLVTRWCCVMSAKFLAERRGNPPPDSVQLEYDRIANTADGLITQIADLKRQLPGIARRSEAPTWSNLEIDRRYARRTARVVRQTSSTSASVKQQHFTHDAGIEFL